jgi:hypothetical protein
MSPFLGKAALKTESSRRPVPAPIGAHPASAHGRDAGSHAAIATQRAVSGRRRAFAEAPDDRREVDLEALVLRLVAAFRRRPHVSNVLTHICGVQWDGIAQALRAVFSSTAALGRLSPLPETLIELMWAERGVTGRILKPYLRDLLASILPQRSAERLLDQVAALSLARQARALPLPPDRVKLDVRAGDAKVVR